jgi:CubicO group peptidase (beta-lactamase class C family)
MRKLFIFFLLLPFAVTAQKNYTALLDQYMQAQTNVNEFSGTVLVAQKGTVLYKKAFGQANREWNVANTVQTKFRIGSLTKQFTAAAILQLAEAGKLTLEDKLSKYFPGFPKGDSVTIHMLLNHTSGIKSYTNMPNFSSVAPLPYSKDSVVAYFKDQPYEFTPGTQYNYNNSGYFLLGYIIEKVSGQPYSRYLHENLVKKAGLSNTSMDHLDSVLVNRATGYQKTPAGWKNAQYISMEFPYSAGAMVSTIEDMHQWTKALFGGKIVSSSLFAKMTTPGLNRYGYGLGIDTFANHKRIGHGGGIPGFISYSSYYPSDDLYIVVLSNNGSNSSGIATALAATLFGKEVLLPYKHQEVKVDAQLLEKYTGKYQAPNSIIELTIKDGKLFRKSGTSVVELKPESAHKFFYADGRDQQINFVLDAKGGVSKAQLISNGVADDLKKID